MIELVVVSGKGGTGKTTVAAAPAHLASADRAVVLVDADVDAANLGLLLDPVPEEQHAFPGRPRAEIDATRCHGCGACLDACRFDAVRVTATGHFAIDTVASIGPMKPSLTLSMRSGSGESPCLVRSEGIKGSVNP